MTKLGPAALVLVLLLTGATASAGTLQTRDMKTYSGVVEAVGPDSVRFLWEIEKDQPTPAKAGDTDLLFSAQGQAAEAREVPLSEILNVDGIPIEGYQAVFGYNLFYRAIQGFAAGKIRATTTGDFVHQVKAIAALLLVVFGLIPLMLLGVSLVLPGEKVGYAGALGLTLALSIAGLAASAGSSLLVGWFPALGTAGAQVGLSLVLLVLFAVVTHVASRFSFLQAVVFTIVWSGALLGAGAMASKIVGGA